jgi:branched-subunit amino acid ABC-type transport system permease component
VPPVSAALLEGSVLMMPLLLLLLVLAIFVKTRLGVALRASLASSLGDHSRMLDELAVTMASFCGVNDSDKDTACARQ